MLNGDNFRVLSGAEAEESFAAWRASMNTAIGRLCERKATDRWDAPIRLCAGQPKEDRNDRIRSLAEHGYAVDNIAERFGLSRKQVMDVIGGRA